MKTVWITLLGITLLTVSTLAEDKNPENQLIMNLQLRPRAEYRNGALNPRLATDEAAAFINNRTRLSMNYLTKGLSMHLSVQNAGVWGQEAQVTRNANLNVYEAWAQLSSPNGYFLKIGRQVLAYDDERILGALDWNTSGRSHDGLKAGMENNDHKLHLMLAFNQNTESIIGGTYYSQGAQPYKTMQTIWYQFTGSETFRPSVLFMNLGIEKGNSTLRQSELASMQTLGTFIVSKPSSTIELSYSAYYQAGKTRTGETISAWMMALQGNYALASNMNLTVGSDYLSGEENANNNTNYNAFNPLYGSHHKFYGAMDYFYASAFTGNLNPGLWDSYLGLSYKASKSVSMSAFYHYFAITADLGSGTGINPLLKKGLGSEIDLQLDWNVRKDVRLSCGYSTMLGTPSMDRVKGGDHKVWQDWGWISINFSPRILSHKF